MKESLIGSPIAKLMDLGITDHEIGEIVGVTVGAVSKWRNGRNIASAHIQARAKAYLDTLKKYESADKTADSNEERLMIVSVPRASLEKFKKVMTMIGLNYVDMDE